MAVLTTSKPVIDSKAGLDDASFVDGIPAVLSDIECLAGTDESIAAKQHLHSMYHISTPLAVVRPRTADEVSRVVRHAIANNLPFTISSGGHGFGFVDGVLCIDMRKFDHVTVSGDKKTAIIGGGALTSKVVTDLSAHGVLTPIVPNGTIGYVGWASQGGWGTFNNTYGFGVDQIVGATVVNNKGHIVVANEEMLQGIRGGSGNLGIIIDMTIKVYELETVFSGIITLDASAGIANTFVKFVAGLQLLYDAGLPKTATIDPFIPSSPEENSKIQVSFTSTNTIVGRAILDQVLAITPIIENNVSEITLKEFAESVTQPCLWGKYGKVRSVNVTRWSSSIHEVVHSITATMPAAASSKLYIRPMTSITSNRQASVFNSEMRTPHFMIEIVGNTDDKDMREEVSLWADLSYRALRSCEEAMSAAQPTLLDDADKTPEIIFGRELKNLRSLKSAYDPTAVFKGAIPMI